MDFYDNEHPSEELPRIDRFGGFFSWMIGLHLFLLLLNFNNFIFRPCRCAFEVGHCLVFLFTANPIELNSSRLLLFQLEFNSPVVEHHLPLTSSWARVMSHGHTVSLLSYRYSTFLVAYLVEDDLSLNT